LNLKDIKSEFQFVGNQILKLSLKNDFVQLPPQELLSKCVFDVEYEIPPIDILNETDERYGFVDLHLKLNILSKKKERLSLNLSIRGCFTDSVSTPKETFSEMLGLNGCATLYSIARAQIISITSQAMNGGELILPMVNFFKMKEKKDKET